MDHAPFRVDEFETLRAHSREAQQDMDILRTVLIDEDGDQRLAIEVSWGNRRHGAGERIEALDRHKALRFAI